MTNFTAGAAGDVIQGLGAAAPTTGIGVAVANGFVAGTTFFISGTYNAGTGRVTVKPMTVVLTPC